MRLRLPRLHPVRRREELENLLDVPRDIAPDIVSVELLVTALQKTLDRQYGALEAADRKAAVLLGTAYSSGRDWSHMTRSRDAKVHVRGEVPFLA